MNDNFINEFDEFLEDLQDKEVDYREDFLDRLNALVDGHQVGDIMLGGKE